MTTTTKVLLGAAGAFGLYWLYKVRAVGNLVFFPGPITAMRFEGVTPVMSFQVIAQNSSSLGVSVQSLAGNLFSKGLLIGNVFSVKPIQLAGNARGYVNVEARFFILGIVNDIIASFQNRDFVQNITFEGFANVEGVQVPIKLSFNVGLD